MRYIPERQAQVRARRSGVLKVDQRAIAGIQAKIARADQHFRILGSEMAQWTEDRPWGFVKEKHDNGRKYFYRIRLKREIPITWAVLLGEAVHDLRSALEQCVFWLTVDWTGKEVGGTAFPICTKRSIFLQKARNSSDWSRGSGMYKIRGVGPGPQKFIEGLQPYPQRQKFYCFDVRAIHDIWNQDKHRLVHLWGIRLGGEQLRVDSSIAADCTLSVDRRILHDHAIALKIVCDHIHPDMEVKGEFMSALAFKGPRRPSGGSRSLFDVARTNADVVNKLLCSLDNQDRAITLDVWTAGPSYPEFPESITT